MQRRHKDRLKNPFDGSRRRTQQVHKSKKDYKRISKHEIMENIHHHDIFYKTTPEQFLELVDWAEDKAFEIRVDVLKKFQRERTDKTLDDFKKLLNKENGFNVVIYRRGYENRKGKKLFKDRWCIEIGSNVDVYYLFMYLKEDYLTEMIEKFKLKEI